MCGGERQRKEGKQATQVAFFPCHPGRREKQVIAVVSDRCEIEPVTPEEEKASHYSGEMPLRDQERHPGRREKQVTTVVSRRCEIRRGTPEEEKVSHYSGEWPLRDQERHPGRRKSKSLQW